MGPIDYRVDVATPFQAAMQGYEGGAAIRNDQFAQQQQQAALAQRQQQQQMLGSLMGNKNPTADDYARATLAIPGMREQFKQAWDMRNTEQQQSSLAEIGQVHAALTNGQPQFAIDLLNRRVEALKNSGAPPEQIKAAQDMAGVIESNPTFARALTGMKLASVPGGDKVLTNLATMGGEQRAAEKAPVELAKLKFDTQAAAADAETKRVKAKYADSEAVLDLQKKGWDIKAVEADIGFKRETNRIAAMNAAISREGNDLKRQELRIKIDDAITARDTKVREKVAEAETGAAAVDNMLNTVERIKKNPRLDAVVGPLEGRMPALASDNSADAIALIETLGSQAFLAQIQTMKGMGALSDAEGAKVQNALTNLSRKQSETQFRANLDEVSRLLNKARGVIEKRTGVPLGKPDTPAAPGARPPLASFNQ